MGPHGEFTRRGTTPQDEPGQREPTTAGAHPPGAGPAPRRDPAGGQGPPPPLPLGPAALNDPT